ncbi:hypothetical protein [Micromonospora sp. NPDC049171]|uniref:hypothetical protein n=1 Tax=Micromonospora sp. NPDC049171 TaxID=3155770 RepID=UPI0033DF2A22
MTNSNLETSRRVFGVTTVLSETEAKTLLGELRNLWRMTYGVNVGDLAADLASCKKFFDPLTRGQSLRERLAQLPPTPANTKRRLGKLGSPAVVDSGEGNLLIGVEGRLLIDILDNEVNSDSFVVISPSRVAEAEHRALEVYRSWTLAKLNQVIDLRTGRGKEVMQAIAVGVVLALLVNRSDSTERAVIQPEPNSPVNSAVFAGAERFAETVTGSRRRSLNEQRLKGGYGLSEAKRRLAPKLAATKVGREVLLYIPASFRMDVIEFIARDLSRRPALTEKKLAIAFDQLVISFRASSDHLAHQSMVFERPADTRDLRASLLTSFRRSQIGDGTSTELET